MSKIIIIGAGLSAAITKILIKKKIKIFGTLTHKYLENNYIRRDKIEVNKIFSKKALSYGSLNLNLRKSIFHDRLTFGGNLNIWGGKINLNKVPKKVLKLLTKSGIFFKKISYNSTGTISNSKNIYQMQSYNDKIFNLSHIPIKIDNYYLKNIFFKKKEMYINLLKAKNKKIKKLKVEKLFLCIGSIQMIDLLYRSNFIKENDVIEFTEFNHKFKLNNIFSKFEKKAIVVRFLFSRALGHFLGIQYFSKWLKLINFIPLCIDQNFYYKKTKIKLIIKKNTLHEAINHNNKVNKFGNSIHYCNMKINNVSIREYLKKINPALNGFGMSFINQSIPGPISNEIIKDIYNQLNKLSLQKK